MAITIKSKVKEIIDNPEALAIVKKHIEFDETNSQMQMALGMSLKALLAFPQSNCPKDKLKAIAADLEAANLE